MIASFSRALLEGLTDEQTDDEFNATLEAPAGVRRSLSPRASAAARCAFGLLPGGRPGRTVRVGIGTPQLSFGVLRIGGLGRLPRPGRGLPGLVGPGLGLSRLGRSLSRPGLLRRRDLSFEPGPHLGLLPRGVLPHRGHLLRRGLLSLTGLGLRGGTSCSAAAFPATASASRASASATALRACPASASACSARAASPARASSAAAI